MILLFHRFTIQNITFKLELVVIIFLKSKNTFPSFFDPFFIFSLYFRGIIIIKNDVIKTQNQ